MLYPACEVPWVHTRDQANDAQGHAGGHGLGHRVRSPPVVGAFSVRSALLFGFDRRS